MEDILRDMDYLIDLKVGDFIRENPFLKDHKEDLVQEARMMLVEKLPQYDESLSSIETYVRNHTMYACYKYRTELAKTIIVGDGGVECIEAHEDLDIRPFIEQVGIKDKQEVDMIEYHIKGFNQTQIAEMTGTYQQHVSRVGVKKNRHAALVEFDMLIDFDKGVFEEYHAPESLEVEDTENVFKQFEEGSLGGDFGF